jgi:hypothetical protein
VGKKMVDHKGRVWREDTQSWSLVGGQTITDLIIEADLRQKECNISYPKSLNSCNFVKNDSQKDHTG